MAELSRQEWEEARILQDPVTWAYAYLGWRARRYQEKILRSKRLRKALRMGRRTGKTTTMCVFMLWFCFTNKDKTCLVVTPFEAQIRKIWDELEKLYRDSPEVQLSIKRHTRNPFVVEFKNGSRIVGFTAGTKSGSEGAGVRGQGADWIFLDEADYMAEEDIVAVTSVALEAPGRIGICVSSTPSGRRGFFYKICTDPDSPYEEFHFPSTVNPEWTEEADREFRLFHSDVEYQHEIMAEFGEEATGVFNKMLVEKAYTAHCYAYSPLQSWQLEKLREEGTELAWYGPYTRQLPAPPALRTMGVDWDKYGATPRIVILEYDPDWDKFRVVWREEIPRTQFTLDMAVQRIIELNEIYNPAFIYCDRGYGEYQVETLHAYGLAHPESGLHKKVKGWVFNNVVELLDPFTRDVERKPVKHFMVNQTALLLERERLLLSPFDDVLYKQFLNYSVVRITTSGAPVYTSKDEHDLDAAMLCVLAFVLEFPDLASSLYKPSPTRTVGMLKNLSRRFFGQAPERGQGRGRQRRPTVGPDRDGPAPRRTHIRGHAFVTWGQRRSLSGPPRRSRF